MWRNAECGMWTASRHHLTSMIIKSCGTFLQHWAEVLTRVNPGGRPANRKAQLNCTVQYVTCVVPRAYGRFLRYAICSILYTVYQAYSNVRFFSLFPFSAFSFFSFADSYVSTCIFAFLSVQAQKTSNPISYESRSLTVFPFQCRHIFNYRRHLFISLWDPNRAVIVILSCDKRPRYPVPYSWFISQSNILLSITPNFKTSHHGLLSIDPLWQRWPSW